MRQASLRKAFNDLGGGLLMGLLVLCAGVGAYGATLYQVALPASGINTSSGRSDVDALNCANQTSTPCNAGGGAYGVTNALGGTPSQSTSLYGDSFTMNAGASYIVTSITVYAVDNLPSNNCTMGVTCGAGNVTTFKNEFNTIGLFFGSLEDYNNPSGNTPPNCSNGVGTCSFPLVATNPAITQVALGTSSSNAACSANLGYLAADGTTCVNVYEVTFSGLNITLQGGDSYSFAVDAGVAVTQNCAGTTQDPDLCGWYNLQSNNGSNGAYPGSAWGAGVWGWDGSDLTGGSAFEANGMNMDVQIVGAILTPEPSSLLLSGLGIGALALIVIRRRKLAANTVD